MLDNPTSQMPSRRAKGQGDQVLTVRHCKPRVLMASSVHPWNDVRVYFKMARSIASFAHVRLIAVQAPGSSAPPDGRICIDLLPANGLRPGDRKSIILRLKRIGMVMRSVLNGKYDVFHFHDPELIPAGWLAKLRGKKVIYDVHEDYKSSLEIKDWLPRPFFRVLGVVGRAFEYLSLRVFDRFILAETAYYDIFPSQRCRIVQNYFCAVACHQPTPHDNHQPLKLVYSGVLTVSRGAVDMLAAVKRLRPEGINVTLDLFGNAVGTQIMELIQEGQSKGWLTYHGFVPYHILMKKLPQYHVGLSPLRDHLNYRYSLPTKLLDYMAAGLAVVASNLPRTAEITGDTACAVLHEPGDTEELQQCIRALLNEPTRLKLAQSGRHAISRYSWATQEQALFQLYRDVLG